jgi:2-oxoacid:acceptor oxidoreductase gamma subunit (pyruvate/2-ketoisovalerate family)
MNSGLTEIKLQGYGGQGVAMAAEILAAIMSKAGYQVQSFSQYGSERRGGQVESYLRISKERILVHSGIYEADYLVLANSALFKDVHVFPGVKEGGTLFANASPADEHAVSGKDVRVVTLDADQIAASHGVCLPSGAPVINTTLIGGLIALFPAVPFELVGKVLREKGIPAVEKNIAAAEEAYRCVLEHRREMPVGRQGDARGVLQEKKNPMFRPGVSPCEVECPAGVPIREIVTSVRQGKMEKALRLLTAENPLPGISGRACFHPCETVCNRKDLDQAVAINAIERAISDRGGNLKKPRRAKGNGRKVAVIGSGPAGLSCAYFIRALGYPVTVFEALPVPGGIPRVGIPAYRLPRYIVDREIANVMEAGVELQTGVEVDRPAFDRIMTTYDACFVATGAHQSTRLNIPGEESRDVTSALEFLKLVAMGKGSRVKERVGVIGGGNTAVDAARTAKRLGAREVTIVYRRSAEEMPAYQGEVAHAKEEGVSIIYLAAPARIRSGPDHIHYLECVKMALRDAKGRDGRRAVEPIEGSDFTLGVESIISAVGETVHIPFLPGSVRKKGGLVDVDALGRTSLSGLYAGGDLTTSSRSIAHAIGSGKRAAIGIDLFLRGREGHAADREYRSITAYLSDTVPAEAPGIVSLADLNTHYFREAPRARVNTLPPQTRAAHFNEVKKGLSGKAAVEEAGRCLLCGKCVSCGNCYIFCPDMAVGLDKKAVLPTVDGQICKACGICIEECPHGVIVWEGN